MKFIKPIINTDTNFFGNEEIKQEVIDMAWSYQEDSYYESNWSDDPDDWECTNLCYDNCRNLETNSYVLVRV